MTHRFRFRKPWAERHNPLGIRRALQASKDAKHVSVRRRRVPTDLRPATCDLRPLILDLRPLPPVRPKTPRLPPKGSAILFHMMIKARVREGRLFVDEPTDLPDGTEIDLLPLDPGDWLDETDRAALHEALRQSDADVTAGRLVDAEEILKAIRSG